ncbi:phosphotransferase enzyme family protein [Xylariales sp. PMI_506]|nr:phosphotransferase enzyme family protein [Xylariales sp. PMI_506]
MVRKYLHDVVPSPEVFEWVEDGNQRFIYMALIDQQTLGIRWPQLNEHEKQKMCKELKQMVDAWRTVACDAYDNYIASHPALTWPYQGSDAVQQCQLACGINISHNTTSVFTHDDLVACNIILSSEPNPHVAAIIDWGQAGWYPAYWEYCKARRVRLSPKHFDNVSQEEWHQKYLPMVLEPVDEENY